MLIRIITVGTRMPEWVYAQCQEYGKRMPAELRVEWNEVKAEKRSGKPADQDAERYMHKEAERIRAVLPSQAICVALDERGQQFTSEQLAQNLKKWQDAAKPLALIVGGPDGLQAELKRQCTQQIALSKLTLPHPLVRVVLAEQLYRAWSILAAHPYHRA